MRRFAQVVDELGLVDLQLQGGSFTWSGALITSQGLGCSSSTSGVLRSDGMQALEGCVKLNRLQEAGMLELPFSEAEVQAALMDMNGDKAPGPDGFTLAFWQSCWDFVKDEILDMFKEFYEQNAFLKSLNNTFLVLLPKKGGAEDLGDFRPISLLGSCISYWLRCWPID
ncbi:hypothetical protein AAG906_003834 [Vitis piasezkii]